MLDNNFRFRGTWRTYQQRVLDKYDIYSQDQKLHIVAAPGSGKTTLGIELMLRVNKPSLVLVPSITIREQWVERICDAFLMDSLNKDEYISQNLKEPKLITVATYQALHSAIAHYSGELIEENDECKTVEEVDYHDFDIVQCFKQHSLGTICLDECHHLRSEWWKALETFKASYPTMFTIALTATPPYDSELALWTRYMDMCGDIDEEITVPELVKDGTLCPHQDYVYFNYPTDEEKQKVNVYRQDSHEVLLRLMQDQQFCEAIKSHRFFTTIVEVEELLDNPAYLSSMIIFLNEKHVEGANKYQELLGYASLEGMSLKWLEILLQGFLFDDVSSYRVEESYREELLRDLKSKTLIEKRKVALQLNKTIEKMLINSVGKCESIKKIVAHEYGCLKHSLRLLILTDFIRKECENALGTNKDVQMLGVLPFFEQLRRDAVYEGSTLRLGVLCGSVIIIPKEAKETLLEIVGDKGSNVSFQPVGELEDYVKVQVKGNSHFITSVVSELFEKGYMQVLIGTKSLLGEGWDSPCVNALILASFVGSFMLSNQMRGRAIRMFQKDANKTSNIWHLVCVNPIKSTSFLENRISEDFETLSRRMEHFLGLHYQEDTIESGIRRCSIINPPFTAENVKNMNKNMLHLSNDRTHLKERWDRSLAIYNKLDVVDESEVKKEFISAVVMVDVIRILLLLVLGGILGFLVGIPLLASTSNMARTGASVLYLGIFFSGLLMNVKKLFTLSNPMARLELFGKGIRSALEKTNQLDSIHSRVEVESEDGLYMIYLLGGTGRDKTLFTKCVHECYDTLDNQRYLLYNKKRKNRMDGYFVVPASFSKRKEDAIIFASYMKDYIGSYEVVYTRNAQGRKILLQGRIKALANRQDRCISRKKIKGALE